MKSDIYDCLVKHLDLYCVSVMLQEHLRRYRRVPAPPSDQLANHGARDAGRDLARFGETRPAVARQRPVQR